MKKLKNGRWQVRWRERGKHRGKNFRNKELAKKFEAELELGLPIAKKQTSKTFAEYAEDWFRKYCKVNKSESQWAGDMGMIKNHLIPAFGDCPLSELVKRDLLDLRASLKTDKGLSAKTINNIASLARKILETAVDMEFLPNNPFAGVKPLKVPPQPFAYWTIQERERFLSYCKREDPLLWEVAVFASHTGMRLGEIQGLPRNALDFERRAILVHQAYDHKLRKILPYTKGKKIRQIAMNDVVFGILKDRQLLKPTDLVFRKNLRHASRSMKKIIEMAGVRKIRFHDLRHTFASCLAMQGVAMQKIQALLGHVDIKETMRYSHLHPDSLEGVTDKLVHDLCILENQALQVTGS